MSSAQANNKREFREVLVSLHRDGKIGQRRMKEITVELLNLIEKRSRLSPAQLEAKFCLGLQEAHEHETGQEWRRYRHLPTANGKDNQALSVKRLMDVASLAVELEYVTQSDLWTVGLGGLEAVEVLQARLENERAALQIFLKGKALLATGKMPLAPGGRKGGKPRSPRSSTEAVDSYRSWIDTIRHLGGNVFEDREDAEISARDAWLWHFVSIEPRISALTSDDYQLLDHSERPFDPLCPSAIALDRLRVRFSYGWVNQPWMPEYRAPTKRWNELAIGPWPKTDAEVALFFEDLDRSIALSASFDRKEETDGASELLGAWCKNGAREPAFKEI
jgi:hypothetical protein